MLIAPPRTLARCIILERGSRPARAQASPAQAPPADPPSIRVTAAASPALPVPIPTIPPRASCLPSASPASSPPAPPAGRHRPPASPRPVPPGTPPPPPVPWKPLFFDNDFSYVDDPTSPYSNTFDFLKRRSFWTTRIMPRLRRRVPLAGPRRGQPPPHRRAEQLQPLPRAPLSGTCAPTTASACTGKSTGPMAPSRPCPPSSPTSTTATSTTSSASTALDKTDDGSW